MIAIAVALVAIQRYGSHLLHVTLCYVQSWPLAAILTGWEHLPLWLPTASIFLTTSIPSTTWPNTTCLPSSQSVLTVQRKNCEPLVPGPAFAIDRIPGPV